MLILIVKTFYFLWLRGKVVLPFGLLPPYRVTKLLQKYDIFLI